MNILVSTENAPVKSDEKINKKKYANKKKVVSCGSVLYFLSKVEFFYFMEKSCFVLEMSVFYLLKHSVDFGKCDGTRDKKHLDSKTFEYIIWIVNHLVINLAN